MYMTKYMVFVIYPCPKSRALIQLSCCPAINAIQNPKC